MADKKVTVENRVEKPEVDSAPNSGDVNEVPKEGKSTERGDAVDSTESPSE